MSTLKYDAIVIGGGPGGIAAAITLARKKMRVILLERGRFCGAKNLFGGVAYTKSLLNLFPDLELKDIPKERWVTEEGFWLLAEEDIIKITYGSAQAPRGFTAFRAKFDPWLAAKAEEEGVLVIAKTTVVDFLRNKKGQVQGVVTDRPEENSSQPEKVFAPLVIIAEGVNNLLAQKLGLARDFEPEDVVLAVKEVLSLPKGSLESRFGLLSAEDGLAVEILGEATCGLPGNGFLYTNSKTLSLGVGVFLKVLQTQNLKPYELLANLKNHPRLKKYLQGETTLEYGAHLIPEWSVDNMPQVYGPGVLLVGDSAGLVNPFSREGTNLAIYSGLLAGEVGALAREKDNYSEKFLALYREKLEESFILKDLRKIRKLKKLLLTQEHLFHYPYLLNQMASIYFHADHKEKEEVFREIKDVIKKNRGVLGVVKDLSKLFWALRG